MTFSQISSDILCILHLKESSFTFAFIDLFSFVKLKLTPIFILT